MINRRANLARRFIICFTSLKKQFKFCNINRFFIFTKLLSGFPKGVDFYRYFLRSSTLSSASHGNSFLPK